MIGLKTDIIKIMNDMPYYYLQDLLDYAAFLKEKSKKDKDTEYLENIPGMAESILAASNEKIKDCSKTLDW
jgi:hypothetical protein